MKAMTAGTPTSLRTPIQISTAIAIRNVWIGLSMVAAVIGHVAGFGRFCP